MALSTETAAWLEELRTQGELTPEAFNALKSTVEASSKADGFIKGSALRQSDYSRSMAETQRLANELKVKETAVTAYQTELGTWKADADKSYDKALKDREAAERKFAGAVARLKTTAAAAGLAEEDILRDLDIATPVVVIPPKPEETMDTSKFITREQVAQTLQESAMIDASIHDIAAEYFELTGTPLRGASALVQEALAAKKPLTQYAAEKYKFVDLRAAKAEEAYEKRVAADVETRTAKVLSEAALNGGGQSFGRTDEKGSPILAHAFKPPAESTPGQGLSAAVAAYRAGTYKQK